MTTRKDETQPVVFDTAVVVEMRDRILRGRLGRRPSRAIRILFVAERAVAADAIDRDVAADIDQPGARIRGKPAAAHRASATANASCIASSARSKSPKKRISVASALPRLVAEDFFDLGSWTVSFRGASVEPGIQSGSRRAPE